MDNTITERQRRYRERMYKAGFKELRIWVKRSEPKQEKISMAEFVQRLKRLTVGWENGEISRLLNLIIKITKGKKEERKLRKKT